MADVPQFSWPFRFETQPDGSVTFAEVEQDTPAERVASAAVIAATPRGRRLDVPSFGVSSLLFQQGPLNLNRLAAEIRAADDRLDLDASEVLELADATRREVTIHVA